MSVIRVFTASTLAAQEPWAVVDLALAADGLAQPLELAGHPVVELDHVVERLGDLAVDAAMAARQADGEVASPEGAQGGEQLASVDRIEVMGQMAVGPSVPAAGGARGATGGSGDIGVGHGIPRT
jgi:hypothetical protein